MISYIEELSSRPLKNTEIILILFFIAAIIFLINLFQIQISKIKTKKFPKKFPNCATIYIHSTDSTIKMAEVKSNKGTISNIFNSNKPIHMGQLKNPAFYVLPGNVSVNILIKCKEKDKKGCAGHFSFNAEPNGIYEAVFDTQSGKSKLNLVSGENIYFEVPEERENISDTPGRIWQNNKKTSIVSEFYKNEIKRIFKSSVLIMVCISYIVFYGNYSKYYILIPVIIFLVAAFFMPIKGVRKFNTIFDNLSQYDQELIESEFKSPHKFYKLFMGDVHLLSNWLICRHRGCLSIIPIDQIKYLKTVKYSKTYGLAKNLIIATNSNYKYELEFFAGHQKELSYLVSYIQSKNNKVFVQ